MRLRRLAYTRALCSPPLAAMADEEAANIETPQEEVEVAHAAADDTVAQSTDEQGVSVTSNKRVRDDEEQDMGSEKKPRAGIKHEF